jgi:hypothetical protein
VRGIERMRVTKIDGGYKATWHDTCRVSTESAQVVCAGIEAGDR